jgi:membrane protein insertase Oxa1/YidC/SpoIIIJ
VVEWILEHIHVYAGTPWWVSISLTVIAFRAVLFKPYISASDNGARMIAVKPITDPLNKQMMAARGDTTAVLQLRAEIQAINRKAGIKVWKSLVPMTQLFFGYGMFVLLRAMAKLPVPGLETGGALWFQDLTLPDPYLILPAATALALHWVLRVCASFPKINSPLAVPVMTIACYNIERWRTIRIKHVTERYESHGNSPPGRQLRCNVLFARGCSSLLPGVGPPIASSSVIVQNSGLPLLL